MKIYFATDHAGFELKNKLIKYVHDEFDMDVEDCGAHELDPSDDYPEFVKKAAQAVSENPAERKAIILGGSGEGEAMVANRFAGVRAAVYYGGGQLDIVHLSRAHNDANVLSLGARFIDSKDAQEAVKVWLTTEFSEDERHMRRIKSIDN